MIFGNLAQHFRLRMQLNRDTKWCFQVVIRYFDKPDLERSQTVHLCSGSTSRVKDKLSAARSLQNVFEPASRSESKSHLRTILWRNRCVHTRQSSVAVDLEAAVGVLFLEEKILQPHHYFTDLCDCVDLVERILGIGRGTGL